MAVAGADRAAGKQHPRLQGRASRCRWSSVEPSGPAAAGHSARSPGGRCQARPSPRRAARRRALSEVELGQSAPRVPATAGRSGALQLPLAAVRARCRRQGRCVVVNSVQWCAEGDPGAEWAYGANRAGRVRGGREDWMVAAGGHLLREGRVETPVDRQNRPVLAPSATRPPAAGKRHWTVRRSNPPNGRWATVRWCCCDAGALRHRCWSASTWASPKIRRSPSRRW